MRLSAMLLVLALAGVVGGAYLIDTWAVGLAVIFDSLVVGTLALLRDVPAPPERRMRLSRTRNEGQRAA